MDLNKIVIALTIVFIALIAVGFVMFNTAHAKEDYL